MGNTREALEQFSHHLDESMGVRRQVVQQVLSPQAKARDRSRRPDRNFGKIPVDEVMPDPNQPRQEIDEEALDRLANSIRDKGQLAPIRVHWSDHDGKWMIIAGERRWRASKRAGVETVDCYFHENGLTTAEILEQSLIENCLREDLRPMEEAQAFSSLMTLNGWNGKQLAAAIHVGPAKVSRALALLDLPQEVQKKVQAGELSKRVAYEISTVNNSKSQRELADRTTTKKLTAETVAKAARQRRGKPKRKSRTSRCLFSTEGGWRIIVSANKRGSYEEVEQALCQALEEVRHYIACGRQLF